VDDLAGHQRWADDGECGGQALKNSVFHCSSLISGITWPMTGTDRDEFPVAPAPDWLNNIEIETDSP
jgi:hypothetical protein